MQPWKTLSRRTILNHSKYLIVESHTIELPGGHIITDWPWLITPDFVNVLAITDEDKFICLRQTKYAVAGTSLAPVGGYLERGEEPLAAARRELFEETGYQAAEWLDLGHYVVDGNRGVGTAFLFLARGAQRVGPANPDDLEEQELVFLSHSGLKTALADGEFKLLSWVTIIALALGYLRDNDI